MSQFQNMTSMTEAFQIANSMSDGMLGAGFPVVFWIAIFGFTLSNGRGHSITAASFLTAIILFVENLAGMVDYWLIIADLILLAIGLGMIFMERRSYEG